MTRDYKSTVFLPKTDFPMRAGLPQREPEILARWEAIDLYAKLREAAAYAERATLWSDLQVLARTLRLLGSS